ncbi:MAG: hypothetical protein JXA98_00960 [Methanosarcinaceae archaeon]|nr:hypothetical protein [Methanosarcinaceae archaeon]
MIQKNLSMDGLVSRCIEYSLDPHNTQLYDKTVSMCSEIAHLHLRADYYVPPTTGRMVYRPYTGEGHVNMNRTIQEFCSRGRRTDAIITRTRVKDIYRKNFALVIDSSAVTTAQGLGRKLNDDIDEKEAPEILAKIAAVSILESARKTADLIDILPYGKGVDGPFNEQQYSYRKILLRSGAGVNRLDHALARLLQIEWDKRAGAKHLVILTGGLPEAGRMNLLDDIEVQETVLQYLAHMQKRGVRILYIPLLTDERFAGMRIGSHSPRSFAAKVERIGIAVAELNNVQTLPEVLRDGFKRMHSYKTHVAVFE